MKPDLSPSQMSRSEQETENEGNRLIEQIESALAIVAVRAGNDFEALDAAADRIERAARDLSHALRELSRERREAAGRS